MRGGRIELEQRPIEPGCTAQSTGRQQQLQVAGMTKPHAYNRSPIAFVRWPTPEVQSYVSRRSDRSSRSHVQRSRRLSEGRYTYPLCDCSPAFGGFQEFSEACLVRNVVPKKIRGKIHDHDIFFMHATRQPSYEYLGGSIFAATRGSSPLSSNQ